MFKCCGHLSSQADLVYVLEVASLNWSRIPTHGPIPSWRSLHVGLSFAPFGGGSEKLIVLGGTDEHTKCFSSGAPADFVPRILDLTTFRWAQLPPPPSSSGQPITRLRFAAEV